MITYSIIINDDHDLDSHVCHISDVLDGLIRRRKHVLESQIINIRVHCAPEAPKAQPVKLLPALRGTEEKQRPACKRPLNANPRQGKTPQQSRVYLVLAPQSH